MSSSTLVVARLNERSQPLDRGARYEDPLDGFLKDHGLGEVSGGGSMLLDSGEIEYCEVEIQLKDFSPRVLETIADAFERLGAPRGSVLLVDTDERPFGQAEGVAVYLNGTDLPNSVYQESDVNYVYSEFNRLLKGIAAVHSHWEGPRETALYVYGQSAEIIRSRLKPFLDAYPLCRLARVEQIA